MPVGNHKIALSCFGGDRDWLLVMAAVTGVGLALWAGVWSVGIAPTPHVVSYLAFALIGLSSVMGVRLALGLDPTSVRWPVVASSTLLVAFGASVFLPLKWMIPKVSPFWLDRPLADWERTFFGADPWLLLDRMIGWSTMPMDWAYGTWLPMQTLALFMVILAKPSPSKSQALVAYTLTWFLLGLAGALFLASAGPLFYDRVFGGSTFAALGETLRERGAWIAVAESNLMWTSMSSDPPGLVAGISAVPSIHVAISLWTFLTARTMAPRAAAGSFAYFLIVWIGSVQLGWHYAFDGLAGALGMLGIWQLARSIPRAPRIHSRRGRATIRPRLLSR